MSDSSWAGEINETTKTGADYFRGLSARDFLSFGVQAIAYIKPVAAPEGQTAWALHAADGTLLTLQATADMAALLARHNELEPVTVH